jgi:hypothetical protein
MFVHPAEPFADRPPYRPFLAGAPRFAPGLNPVPEALWLRPDPEHEANMANRAAVLAAHAGDAARWDPQSLLAQAEAQALIEAALGLRAPQSGDAPILRAGRLLADDLVVMERREGEWRTTALLLTAPTFFSAADAFGRNLFAIHEPVPGNAPSLTSMGLAARVTALFDRLPDDSVLQRFNWTLQCGDARYTPDGAVHRALAAALGPEAAACELHLRVERQTVRRLPKTGAILFTIRIALDPVRTLAPDVRAALANAWRAADEEARAYKKWSALDAAAEIAFAPQLLEERDR